VIESAIPGSQLGSSVQLAVYGKPEPPPIRPKESKDGRARNTYLEKVTVKVGDNISNRAQRHRPNIHTFKPLFIVNLSHLGPLKI
jgi:hypothetical protein